MGLYSSALHYQVSSYNAVEGSGKNAARVRDTHNYAVNGQELQHQVGQCRRLFVMAEQLSVAAALAGLAVLGGKTIDAIWDLMLPATRMTPVLKQVLHGVKHCRATAHVLCRALSLVESTQLPFPERATWIAVKDLVATLTETVLAFSDILTICTALDRQRRGLAPATPYDYSRQMVFLTSQIRWHNLSMAMMSSILNCPSEVEAQGTRTGLELRMAQLLTANTVASRRMRQLNDLFDEGDVDRALPTQQYTPPNHYNYQPFQLSQRPVPTASFVSSSNGNHKAAPEGAQIQSMVFTRSSYYTLADIPALSSVTLPVTTDELFDGPCQ